MVGIVIVSHSRQLAEGVRELATQMVRGEVPLAVAAGIDDPENPLGTNAMKVYEAIASVYTDEGVIVLMDLGSALMSAEIALEFLTEEQQDKVHLCEAPLVEGVLAAAVAAAAGNNIEQVMAEARGALLAKASQLGIDSHTIQQATPTVSEGQTTQEIRLIVRNALGLHARPASQFVSTAARFQSLIKVQNVTRGTEFVRADSINQVATLAIRQGHEIAITATGSDADRALSTLQALVESHFGEDSSSVQWSETVETAASAPSSGHVLRGIPASPGVAIAPIVHYHAPTVAVQEYHVENPEEELQRLQNALEAAQQEIQTLLSQASTQIGDAEAAIFDAHMLFLEDPVLIEAVYNRILEQHLNAEAAWQGAMDELAHRYSTVDDSYLQQRVVDVVDVGQRVLRLLSQPQITINENIHQSHHLNFAQPSILVASDLTPSDTAKLNPAEVLGICMTSGSPNSHSAILARSLGIPQVVGLPPELLQLTDHTLVAFDGETGEVWIEPESHTLAAIEAKRSAWESAKQQALLFAHQPAITRDRRQIKVYANLGGIGETRIALSQGAEGVGLLRTEFLYLERSTAPSEEEQLAVYQAIAQVLENRPLIIRTLDIGGDKPLAYLGVHSEPNPFLGWRGIRFCLNRRDVFKTQLRAILRASFGHQIKIMFPMIATVEEIQAAKAILAEVQAELRQASILFDEAMEVGIMVEVPSAVLIAEHLATEVDFFSIGTNDLSQYVMACDRTNPQVASLADGLHPAVLRMIQQTVQAGHQAGISVGLCGELAADSLAVPILLGLGLDSVSLNPQAIPRFKQVIVQLTAQEAQAIANSALQQDSAAKVRAIVSSALSSTIDTY
ncbi:phosphoenolpyruvate--protein phosphotransferase [Aetokthonos hydrillicola Thurmond2011]|uniref:Phosphocarrier protein HPr n=3 Tax=Aetokthonos TaxID=1550243 RepID=A0AAP5I9C1_9CYAN|nr:phosphoenolpyruvate--protein phosphotransferase [Aetokthonos hydrillicola]MDR9894840.1 phosphoenolpyruvate--protein phosphotransferase [Aetokthonos hydrillicola Thurmond2011]